MRTGSKYILRWFHKSCLRDVFESASCWPPAVSEVRTRCWGEFGSLLYEHTPVNYSYAHTRHCAPCWVLEMVLDQSLLEQLSFRPQITSREQETKENRWRKKQEVWNKEEEEMRRKKERKWDKYRSHKQGVQQVKRIHRVMEKEVERTSESVKVNWSNPSFHFDQWQSTHQTLVFMFFYVVYTSNAMLIMARWTC